MRNQKQFRSTVAAVTALALVLAGTFAWRTYDHIALNQTEGGDEMPGGRLHDDFNGSDKYVYVENYNTTQSSALPFYARVRLDEYMEIGSGAGEGGTSVEVVRGDIRKIINEEEAYPDFEDVTTWDTYMFKTDAYVGSDELVIASYRKFRFGGQASYMPTFNKDTTSLASDLNGTLEGIEEVPFADFIDYTIEENKTKIDTAYYHYDPDTYIEVEGAVIEEETQQYRVEETHQVKETLETIDVISMEDWKNLPYSEQIHAYWVYDVDGWAYWSQPVEGNSATGLLINGLEQVLEPHGDWYYSVNVVSQLASVSDWGTPATETEPATGMYADGITEDGVTLLNTVSKALRVNSLKIVDGDGTVFDTNNVLIDAIEVKTFGISMFVTAPTAEEEETEVIWEIEEVSGNSGLSATEISGRLVDGVLKPTLNMAGCRYTITATSAFDSSRTDSIDITVFRITDMEIAVKSGWTVIQPGEQAQMVCLMTGIEYDLIEWSLSGNVEEDTWINEKTGVVYVSPLEPITVGGESHSLSITATSPYHEGVNLSYELPLTTISSEFRRALYRIDLGSNTTIEIDGLDFYKIAEGDINGRDAVLLYAADVVGTRRTFHSSRVSAWEPSDIRAALVTWLDTECTILKYQAADALIDTVSIFRTEQTRDRVFLLSQEEYDTYLNELTARTQTNNRYYWLRTPTTTQRARVIRSRFSSNTWYLYQYSWDVRSSSPYMRPAIWVYV